MASDKKKTPQLLTMLVLEFEQVHFTTCWCVKKILNKWQQCRPWSDASGSILIVRSVCPNTLRTYCILFWSGLAQSTLLRSCWIGQFFNHFSWAVRFKQLNSTVHSLTTTLKNINFKTLLVLSRSYDVILTTLVILTSLISNNLLSWPKNLSPGLTKRCNNR